MESKKTFVIAGILIVVAVIYLIISSTSSTANYFLTVEEVLALDAPETERALTVSGAILGETIQYDPTLPVVTFTIVQIPGDPQEVERQGGLAAVLHAAVNTPNVPSLEIVYNDIKPDLLKHEAQAIIRGRLGDDRRFYADEVYLKCPSRYQEALPEQAGD